MEMEVYSGSGLKNLIISDFNVNEENRGSNNLIEDNDSISMFSPISTEENKI